MVFNRPPRIQKPLPNDVIKIPEPKNIPSKPTGTNWLMIVMPLVAVVITILLVLSISEGGSSGLTYLIFIPIMLATYLASGATNWWQKRKYKESMHDLKVSYRADLKETETKLSALQKKQQKISWENNPDLRECIQFAESQDSRLGERRISDQDFLSIRLGLGTTTCSYQIEPINPDLDLEEFKKEFNFAHRLLDEFSKVEETPILFNFSEVDSLGYTGHRSEVLDAIRASITHLATHHWLHEVQLVAIGNHPDDWHWLSTLPHRNRLQVRASKSNDIAKLLESLESELQQREQFIESQKLIQRADEEITRPSPSLIIIFDYLDPSFKHPALSLLLKKGPELAVHSVFLTEKAKHIPSECGATVEISGNKLVYKQTGPEGITAECVPDKLPLPTSEKFSQGLSRIKWPEARGLSQPPEKITFLKMFGVSKVEDLLLEEWWEGEKPYGNLRAPIGKTSETASLIFDLNDHDNAHGPHGLIGGMTGSGKSEFLKTVLLALAVTHHPYDVNFALIDYKGGAAFNELIDLPHTVGVITNIENHASYAERIITALAGEIENRERILETARSAFKFGRSHVDEYKDLLVKRPLPRLIIVFDEFAEFKEKHSEESKKLISIARKGRSLGVHLILATQNIQSAVDPEIMQNSSFRICLRVSDPSDSMQMAGIPDAVNLNRGRAYFSTKTRQLFQAAYAGDPYAPDDEPIYPLNQVVQVWPDGKREIISTTPGGGSSVQHPTEANVIVEHIINTAQKKLRLPELPAVWPDPLAEHLFLPTLLEKRIAGGWDGKTWHETRQWKSSKEHRQTISPFLGLYDLPAKQKQFIYQLNPEQCGDHLLIFGSAGTGKSVMLRTLVTSSVLTNPPDKVNFYILDYGGQSTLRVLQKLPHVGSVATRLEKEKAERIIQYFHNELRVRNELLQEAQEDNWLDCNNVIKNKLPALYLVIDNYKSFRNSMDDDVAASIASLVSGGAASGIFLIISAVLPRDLNPGLFENILTRISFSQADQSEYSAIVGRPTEAKMEEEINLGNIPGRGYLKGNPPLEFQAALPLDGDSDSLQLMNLRQIAEDMDKAWKGKRPRDIEKMPLYIYADFKKSYAIDDDYWIPLGKEYTTLEPIGLSLINDGPYFIIAGVSGFTGKTSLLKLWLISLANKLTSNQIQYFIVDFHAHTLIALKDLPHTMEYIPVRPALEPAINSITI